MIGNTRCVVLAMCAVSFGCASGTMTPPILDAKFAGEDARRAHELAPDLVAEAELARADARGENDAAARRDLTECASLFLDAALAEAERIQFDRERTRIDAETERAVAERAEHERARLAVEAETVRAEAATLAHTAQRECDRSTEDGRGRTKKAERERADAACAAFVLGRAELVLTAATALGLAAEAREEALRSIATARDTRGRASERVRRARVALQAAERALAGSPAPATGRATPD